MQHVASLWLWRTQRHFQGKLAELNTLAVVISDFALKGLFAQREADRQMLAGRFQDKVMEANLLGGS